MRGRLHPLEFAVYSLSLAFSEFVRTGVLPVSGFQTAVSTSSGELLQNRGNHGCRHKLQQHTQAPHKIGTTISRAQPGYSLLSRCTKSAAPPQYRQLDQGFRRLMRIVSSEWSAACVTSLHSLRASPALPPQRNTFIIDSHHLRDTFNIMSFLHGSDFSATHVLPPRKRLVSHGIVPDCLLHSNRQLNSIPRLSGQIRLSCGHSSNTFHHSCSAPSNELCMISQQFHQLTESNAQRSLPR